MKSTRKLLAAALALVIVLTSGIPAFAAPEDTDNYIQKMIEYYRYYQEEAQTDLACLHEAMEEAAPEQAKVWKSIMDYWAWLNREMEAELSVLPDGLPNDNTLCIVVMGYALNDSGSMKDELEGRLEVALASAEKYPNAYILCTGGGTARNNKTVTEAGVMADWLEDQGISKSRILVEDDSMSTKQNAQYSAKLLQEYPQIQYLAIVTSDYHLPRSCLLFHAQAQISALEDGNSPRSIVACAGFEAGHEGNEGIAAQARDLGALVGLDVESSEKPELSRLSSISVDGNAVCRIGDELDLTVTAHYDTGLQRTVTSKAKFSGIDLGLLGIQTVTVSYLEEDILVTAEFDVEMTPPPTQPAPPQDPLFPETEATQPVPPETAPADYVAPEDPLLAPAPERPGSILVPVAILGGMLLVLMILIRFIWMKD